MSPDLLDILCDPVDRSILQLRDPVFDKDGQVVSGALVSTSGRAYPIRDGIPRFHDAGREQTVESFGNEWNYFNFDRFKANWLNHFIANTFGSSEVFRGKVIVDAGAGSGMQSVWMAQAGAQRVVSLELSHSVDGVMRKNLRAVPNVDVVQCSIDKPPIRTACIDIVVCHNVIQHTPSVEQTAHALWRLVKPGGEFVFNCYLRYEQDRIWMARYRLYQQLRRFLSKRSFRFLMAYSRSMALMRFVPVLGWFLERSLFMVRGDVPRGPDFAKRSYWAGVLNTFDWYGSHHYQHHKSEAELRSLLAALSPGSSDVFNLEGYFARPAVVGRALRVKKSLERRTTDAASYRDARLGSA